MIKVHLHPTYPKDKRPKDYLGITEVHWNIGPANLEDVILTTVGTIVDFWIDTHDEDAQEINRRVSRALARMSTFNIIQESIDGS